LLSQYGKESESNEQTVKRVHLRVDRLETQIKTVKSFGTGIATLLGGIGAWMGLNNKYLSVINHLPLLRNRSSNDFFSAFSLISASRSSFVSFLFFGITSASSPLKDSICLVFFLSSSSTQREDGPNWSLSKAGVLVESALLGFDFLGTVDHDRVLTS